MITTDVFKGKIHNSWLPIFQSEVGKLYIRTLSELVKQYPIKDNQGFNNTKSSFRLVPRLQDILHPFRCIDLNDVKVVMIFEQPINNMYCTGIPLQSSYRDYSLGADIIKIISDTHFLYGSKNPSRVTVPMDVTKWMEQGVLLINASMTRELKSNSNHVSYWNNFTTALIDSIYNHNKECLFVVIGNDIHDVTCNLPKEAHIIYTPQGVCKTEQERATFHKSNFFKTIDQELSSYDQPVLINW